MNFAMVALIDVAVFWCMVCAALACLPRASEQVPHLAGARGVRRPLLAPALSLVGKLMVWRRTPPPAEWPDRQLYAGCPWTPQEFGGLKVLSALGACVGYALAAREWSAVQPLWGLGPAAIGFVAPDLWLRARLRRRQKAIIRLLPEVIDLLSLCVGAGLDFLGALQKMVVLKGFQGQPLVEELSLVSQEIRLGKRRADAFKAMAKRVDLPELSSFVRTLVQADRMGTPIEDVLTMHSEDLRSARFIRAERAALKAPIKILIPLIFCIMPCVAIIVGAPIFIQFMTQNPFGK